MLATHAIVMVYALLLTGILIAIAVIDFRYQIIPDSLNAALLFGGLSFAAQQGLQRVIVAAVVAATIGLMFLLLRWLYFQARSRQGLGLGDVKFLAAVSTWVTWDAMPWLLLIACLSGLAFAAMTGLTGRGQHYARLAFGPHLCVGTAVVWLLQSFS